MFPSGMSEAHAQILLRWVNCTCFVLSDKFFFCLTRGIVIARKYTNQSVTTSAVISNPIFRIVAENLGRQLTPGRPDPIRPHDFIAELTSEAHAGRRTG